MYITKFPIRFSGDGKAETTSHSMDQFDLFTNVRPFTLVREPEYGMDAEVLLQTSFDNLDGLMGIYLVTLREKVARYFTNITVSRATAQFNPEDRLLEVTVFVIEEGEETKFQFSVKVAG